MGDHKGRPYRGWSGSRGDPSLRRLRRLTQDDSRRAPFGGSLSNGVGAPPIQMVLGLQCCPDRAMLLRVIKSFRMQATNATLWGFPRLVSCS